MQRIASTLVLVLSLAALAPGCFGLGSFPRQDDSRIAARLQDTGDCQDAVDQCEDMVVALCDRGEQCGFLAFDDCVDQVLDRDLPCERAQTATDNTPACTDEIADATCSGLQSGDIGRDCADQGFFFDDVCE